MKYAKEVIGLMSAHPNRDFRMAQIIRHVTQGREVSAAKRQAIRVGVRRVLSELVDSGQVTQVKESATTSLYVWSQKLIHEVSANCYVN